MLFKKNDSEVKMRQRVEFRVLGFVLMFLMCSMGMLAKNNQTKLKYIPLKLPDLKVEDIIVKNNCTIYVVIKNIGSAGVPDSHYDGPSPVVSIQLFVDGQKKGGGMILKSFDPQGKLKIPGGIAVKKWNYKNLNPGFHFYKVIVDPHEELTELKEDNNKLKKNLKCKPKLPDPAEED
jgi:hypothetical protein